MTSYTEEERQEIRERHRRQGQENLQAARLASRRAEIVLVAATTAFGAICVFVGEPIGRGIVPSLDLAVPFGVILGLLSVAADRWRNASRHLDEAKMFATSEVAFASATTCTPVPIDQAEHLSMLASAAIALRDAQQVHADRIFALGGDAEAAAQEETYTAIARAEVAYENALAAVAEDGP